MDLPPSLSRDISPPPTRPLKRKKLSSRSTSDQTAASTAPGQAFENIKPTLAAIEAGRAKIEDHLTYFRDRLSKSCRETPSDIPRLSIQDFSDLYASNQHQHGCHYVIHQHNHPRAGVHYDLRLQFSETSSMSFAIPKGLPGNPNSKSIGRMAIETRVHNYWNHLIESASSKTGSLLIWDTGIYSVLPRTMRKGGIPSPQTTEGDESSSGDEDQEQQKLRSSVTQHQNQKLISAFQTRYIRLRLHGTKLPLNYTIILRLPSNEIIKAPTSRRKSRPKQKACSRPPSNALSDSDTIEASAEQSPQNDEDIDTDSSEDAQTRSTNAYPGSTNDIGSIHQRHWFLQLDRQNSGFVLDAPGGTWVKNAEGGGFDTFLVRGRDVERSVVTGRLATEVESDEGVEGFVGRGGWVGVER